MRPITIIFYLCAVLTLEGQDCELFQEELKQLVEADLEQTERLSSYHQLASKIDIDSCPGQVAFALGKIGVIQVELNLMDAAFGSFNRQLELAEKDGGTDLRYSAHQNLGYWNIVNYRMDSALVQSRSALALAEQTDDDKYRSSVFQNLSNSFYHLGQMDSAQFYCDRLMEVGKAQDDKEAIGTAIQLLTLIKADTEGVSEAVLTDMKDCLKRFEDPELVKTRFAVIENIGYLYQQQGEFDSAIVYYGQASLLAQNEMNSVDDLSWMNEKVNNVNELMAKRERKNAFRMTAVILGLILVLALSAFYIYNRQQRIQLAEARASELAANNERDAAEAMLQGQDGERQRISEDLHDRLGGMLALLGLRFGALAPLLEQATPQHRADYEQAGGLIDDTAREVRRISHDLYSSVLKKFGLIPALDELSETLEKADNVDFLWSFSGMDERLGLKIEENLYRIISESTQNIISHAQATEATVQLIRHHDSINLMVEDDGVGFDPSVPASDTGIGLMNIRSRVARMKGELGIDSQLGKGTTIVIDIPLIV